MVKLSIIIPYYETYELTHKLIASLFLQVDSDEVEIVCFVGGG